MKKPKTNRAIIGRIELVSLLKTNAYGVYLGTLIGNAPPKISALFEELSNPMPGDLVMEVTTHRMKHRDPIDGIGRLLRIATEKKERVYYIAMEFGDGREQRWVNAKFIKIKEDEIPL